MTESPVSPARPDATQPGSEASGGHLLQESPDALPTAAGAVRDPADPTHADELTVIAAPGKPDGEVDTRPR